MVDLFKTKDYRLEFENRCRSKVEEKVLNTREKHGLEVAKVEENIRKSVCNCIAPHANRDLYIVWGTMFGVTHAMNDAAKTVLSPGPVKEYTAPVHKSDFDRICHRTIEFLKKRYTGKKADDIDEVGKSICNCVSENVLPFIGKGIPVFATAMYDAKHSLRDEETIKKFEEKMTLETMRRRREIPSTTAP